MLIWISVRPDFLKMVWKICLISVSHNEYYQTFVYAGPVSAQSEIHLELFENCLERAVDVDVTCGTGGMDM